MDLRSDGHVISADIHLLKKLARHSFPVQVVGSSAKLAIAGSPPGSEGPKQKLEELPTTKWVPVGEPPTRRVSARLEVEYSVSRGHIKKKEKLVDCVII